MFLGLVNNIAFLIALVAIGQLVFAHFQQATRSRQIWLGVVFGGITCLGMANPVEFSPGVIFDGRSIVLAVAGVTGGAIAAAIAATMAALYRYSLGGVGALIGVVVIVQSALLGVAARYWWLNSSSQKISAFKFFGLGVVVQLAQLVAFTQIPNSGFAFIEKAWWILLSAYPLATMLLCLIFRNYEQHQHSQLALRQAENEVLREKAILRTLIDTLPDLIWLKDPQGVYLACNRRFEQFFGAPEEKILGKTDYDFLTKDLAEFFRAKDMAAAEKNAPSVNEEEICFASDGHREILETTKTPMRDEKGNLIGVLGIGHNITERKQAEQALENREQQLRFVLEGANLGFWDWDIAANTVHRNARWAEMLGYTFSEIQETPQQWTDFIYPEDREAAWNSIQAVLDGRSDVHRLEYRMLHKNGNVRWILDQAKVMQRDGKGCPLRMCGTHTDITERRLAEQRLLDSDKRLNMALRIARQGWFEANLQTGNVSVSPEYPRMLGFDPDEFISTLNNWLANIHPEDLPQVQQHLQKAIETGTVQEIRYRRRNKAGEWQWLDSVGQITERDATGQPLRLTGIHMDVTERIRAEEALRANRARLDFLLSSSPAIIYTRQIEAPYAATFVSNNIQDLLGYPAAQVTEDPEFWATHIHPEDRSRVLDELQTLFITGNLQHRYRFLMPNGDYRWLNDRQRLIRSPDGRNIEIVGYWADVDNLKRTEDELIAYRDHLEHLVETRTAELAQAKQAAEAASLAKSLFLANMSHEIRTPLNGVLGLAQIGFRNNYGRKEAQETFSQILHSGKLLLTIINDILDFSKIEAGKLALEEVPLDPAQLVDDTLQGVTILASSKSIRLRADKAELPSSVLGDPVRITQVLYNLLSNAIKFTEHGEVTLSARVEGEQLLFIVSDTGIGISEETIKRLFQPFEQADSSVTRKFGGTGLGLTISHRLAKLMGGALSVESTLGKGSAFCLRLPLKKSSQPVLVETWPNIPGNNRLSGLNLLVVEDNAINQLVLEDMLRAEGAKVSLAHNGQHALTAVAHADKPFDAILMDIQMPVMDGLEATRHIKQQHPQQLIVGQTAHALTEEIEKCQDAGMAATITKPIDLEILVSTLLKLLARSAAPKQPEAGSTESLAPHATLIDWQGFAQRYNNRTQFIEHLAELFVQVHANDGEKLREFCARKDMAAIERIAHDLKGTAGNIFANTVQELAKKTMESARQNSDATFAQAMALASHMDRLILELKQGHPPFGH